MDLSIGDRVLFTRSNGVQVTAGVVETAPEGFVHLEYQDVGRVVNQHSKLTLSPSPSQVPINHLTAHPAPDLDLVGGF